MVWAAADKLDLLLNIKELGIKMGEVISRRMDLGQPIHGYIDSYFLICNLGFAVEEDYTYVGTTGGFTDDEYDYLYSLYTKTLTKHNRYKGV